MKKFIWLSAAIILVIAAGCSDLERNDVTAPHASAPAANGPALDGWRCFEDPAALAKTVPVSGNIQVGVLLVNLTGTATANVLDSSSADYVSGRMALVDDLYDEMSDGSDTVETTIIGIYSIANDISDPSDSLWAWRAHADAAAGAAAIAPYDVLMYVFPKGTVWELDGFGGTAGNDIINMFKWWDLGSNYAHELGHLRGFSHSGLASSGSEYGDFSCFMSSSWFGGEGGQWVPLRQPNAVWKAEAGYFDAATEIRELTAPGTHTVYLVPTERIPAEAPTTPDGSAYRLLKVHQSAMPTTGDVEFFSFRRSEGAFDSSSSPTFAPLMDQVHVHSQDVSGGDSWRQDELSPGDTYYGAGYSVTFENFVADAGGPETDSIVELTVVIDEFLPPSDLDVVTVTSNQAVIDWSAVPNAVQYTVGRDNVPVAVIDGSGPLEYVDTNVVAGATYDYQVFATNADSVDSDWSDPLTVVMDCADGFGIAIAPAARIRSTIIKKPGATAETWTVTIDSDDSPSCGSRTFTISGSSNSLYDVAPNPASVTIPAGGSTTVDVKLAFWQAAGEGIYPFTVTVDDADPGIADQDVAGNLIIDLTAPSVPNGLASTMKKFNKVKVIWNPSSDPLSGVASYEIKRDGSIVGGSTTNYFVDTVDAMQSHTYAVRAIDAAGHVSGWSALHTYIPGIQ
ncbi:fibronectin type III domain-containing protein [bacterium]|nr:fibronectin type III domain-containing protein [bacterium]